MVLEGRGLEMAKPVKKLPFEMSKKQRKHIDSMMFNINYAQPYNDQRWRNRKGGTIFNFDNILPIDTYIKHKKG